MGPLAELLVCVLLLLSVGGLGAMATYPNIASWYAGLVKPSWTPPNALFGPVWTALYLMMAVSLWRVWRRRRQVALSGPLGVFGCQLVLNAAWSWLFFAWHRPDWAMGDILLLWIFILITIRRFYVIDRWAARLLIPYLAWVSFATALNAAIVVLNP